MASQIDHMALLRVVADLASPGEPVGTQALAKAVSDAALARGEAASMPTEGPYWGFRSQLYRLEVDGLVVVGSRFVQVQTPDGSAARVREVVVGVTDAGREALLPSGRSGAGRKALRNRSIQVGEATERRAGMSSFDGGDQLKDQYRALLDRYWAALQLVSTFEWEPPAPAAEADIVATERVLGLRMPPSMRAVYELHEYVPGPTAITVPLAYLADEKHLGDEVIGLQLQEARNPSGVLDLAAMGSPPEGAFVALGGNADYAFYLDCDGGSQIGGHNVEDAFFEVLAPSIASVFETWAIVAERGFLEVKGEGQLLEVSADYENESAIEAISGNLPCSPALVWMQ